MKEYFDKILQDDCNGCESFEKAFDKVKTGYYKDIFKDLECPYMELSVKRYFNERYRKMVHSKNPIVSTFGYLYMREYEIADIISVIEGKRYSMDRNEILSYMINGVKT